MTFQDFLVVFAEVLLPLILAFVARNTEITKSSLTEIKALKKQIESDKHEQTQWIIEVRESLKRNDFMTERNSTLIAKLVDHSFLGNKNENQ
ncbi:hypothetical protein Riv7116_2111 [Rivularia sp. PCC 7116]|uniref:hypothetical protein n=1 Tax=Rivularia sp. PCC 7116 TaxID=373994 RepID=UPI00029F016B|nr:hypothetical protein [Rivularia sp. PCC 7116]AFY54642.1 hypothetical protein Riv7116_2111 [Rivularia sp. PCC 7116]